MKKKKVLVTGGCGFVGSEVVKQLLEKDYEVVIADNFSNSDSLKGSPFVKIIDLDLTRSEGISGLFDDIDYCIHLAASVGGIKYMTSQQAEILYNDILIDANVIKEASLAKVKIVYASTVIVYDQSEELPFREEQRIRPPKSNYGFSKYVGERLCQVFGKDLGLKFSIARISNVYGINKNNIDEKKLHVIPDLIRKISKDKTLKLINGGKQERTFVHVSDVVAALIVMMENEEANGEIFNIASNDKYQILNLAKIIWSLLKNNEEFIYENVELKDDSFIKNFADASKINRVLKWKVKKTLKQTLPEMIEWYSKNYA